MTTLKEIEDHLQSFPEPTVDIEYESDVSFNREYLWHWYQNLVIMVDDYKKTLVPDSTSKGEHK